MVNFWHLVQDNWSYINWSYINSENCSLGTSNQGKLLEDEIWVEQSMVAGEVKSMKLYLSGLIQVLLKCGHLIAKWLSPAATCLVSLCALTFFVIPLCLAHLNGPVNVVLCCDCSWIQHGKSGLGEPRRGRNNSGKVNIEAITLGKRKKKQNQKQSCQEHKKVRNQKKDKMINLSK